MLVASLYALTTLALSPPAAAYERVGFDPDEPAEIVVPGIADIRTSILRVEPGKSGRVLVLVVRSYERFGIAWLFTAYLDSRGGESYDRVMYLHHGGCTAYTRAGFQRWKPLAEGVLQQQGKAARCHVPIRYFDPTKSIRWRVRSEDGGDPSAGSDAAPDRGMYG